MPKVTVSVNFKGAGFIYDNSFFKIQPKNQLSTIVFAQNFVFWKILGC